MRYVTAAIMVRDAQILLGRRKPGGMIGGKWEFPGGKLEAGERPEDGIRREIREELGIAVRVGDFLGSSRFKSGPRSFELLAYLVTPLSNAYTLAEHDEIRWVPLEELTTYDLPESDMDLIPLIRAALHKR